jgi:hypothetical protein
MWICNFDQPVSDFLKGKSDASTYLFYHFMQCYIEIGEIKPQATKTMIALKADKSFAYIIKLGKDFIDVVFPFKTFFSDNLCFHKIARVPGTDDYNHHLRIYNIDDVNDEVKQYMKLAYLNGKTV